MQRAYALNPESFDQASPRILRLLSLYRVVGAVGAIALILGESGPGSIAGRGGTLSFVLFYLLLHLVTFLLARTVWERPHLALTLFAFLDVVFILLVSNVGGSTLFFAGMMPILVTHGWLLRNKVALLHASIFAFAAVLASVFEPIPLTQSGFLGAGAFAAAILGVYLGRMGGEAMELADRRGEDIAKLSSLNQRIIDESEQGILLVDREGRLLQANPQAERWMFDAGIEIRLPTSLMNVSQALGVQWANWREGHTMLDSGVTLGTGESQVKVRPRFVSTELRRAGDAVVFLEDLGLAQARAQQLKLAALGRLTANIAHEIRNPLSAIRQAGQLLSEGPNSTSATDRRLTEMIEKNVRRIDRIVTNVLSLSKRDRVAPQVLDVGKTLRELIKEWAESAAVRTTALRLMLEPGVWMRADAGHIEEIIWNLLSNAWRHSRQGDGSILVSARLGASHRLVVIEVADDGPGVPMDHRESIFEPFFSMSGSSGLGLYISRELAESNGGALELTAYEHGAQFRLVVPAVFESEFSDP